jgi:hypothetical protein
MINELWSTLESGHGFTGVLQVFAKAGIELSSLPDFAIVVCEPGGYGTRVVVRGQLVVSGLAEDGPFTVNGYGATSWQEKILLAPHSIEVLTREKQSTDVEWPIQGGVVLISSIRMMGDQGEGQHMRNSSELMPISRPESQSLSSQYPVVQTPVDLANLREPLSLEPEQVPSRTASMEQVSPFVEDLSANVISPVPVQSTGQTTLMQEDYEPPEPDEDPDLKSTTYYLGLFEPQAAQIGNSLPHSSSGQGNSDDHDGHTIALVPSEDDDHDGMTVMSLSDIGSEDHDGMTVMDVPSFAAPAPAPPPVVHSSQPTVLARLCPACRTPNSTRRVDCRSCHNTLSGDAMQIPRPSLGQIRLPSGDVIPIDKPVIIGRKPEATRFSNSDIPLLIGVNDPHISSTHLKIDLEDWSVLVTSMGRNGTILRRIGQPDRRFTKGEQVIAQAGDVYCLSSELSLTVLELA